MRPEFRTTTSTSRGVSFPSFGQLPKTNESSPSDALPISTPQMRADSFRVPQGPNFSRKWQSIFSVPDPGKRDVYLGHATFDDLAPNGVSLTAVSMFRAKRDGGPAYGIIPNKDRRFDPVPLISGNRDFTPAVEAEFMAAARKYLTTMSNFGTSAITNIQVLDRNTPSDFGQYTDGEGIQFKVPRNGQVEIHLATLGTVDTPLGKRFAVKIAQDASTTKMYLLPRFSVTDADKSTLANRLAAQLSQ
jgi:hypothetical protein